MTPDPFSSPDLVAKPEGFTENVMQTMPLAQAEGHMVEIVAKLTPGEEIVLTCDDKPVATIRAAPAIPHGPPRFGKLRGSILYIAPDFDAIPEGFEDYLP